MTPPSPQLSADNQLDALASSAPDAILAIGEDSIIQFANPAVEPMFGYSPQELVGQSLLVIIPERLRAAHRTGLARYIRTGTRNIPWTGAHLTAARRDGTEFPVEISFGEYIGHDGRRVFSGFIRDVSERVRQRQELEAARAAAERALTELARLGRITDPAIAQSNYDDMLSELLLHLSAELAADDASLLLLDETRNDLALRASTDPLADPHANVRVPLGRGVTGSVAASGEPRVIDDLRTADVVSDRLRSEFASLVAVPVKMDDRVIGVLEVASRTPRQFTDPDVRLLEIVADRMSGSLARTRLYVQAQAAIRSRDDVLSIVSHDLRNPVSTVMMSAALLADPEIHLSDADRRKQIEIIRRSAQRMNRLIQDLVDVARIEVGRLSIACRCEDAGLLASEAAEAFRTTAAEKAVALECRVEPGLPRVYADRDRILQALLNFLNNAVKFTREGGRVSVAAAPVAGGGVRYTVSDTGPGIAPNDLPHVFDRFWQAKRTAHLGSGLGLAIAKGVAEAHRGRVGAESRLGEGSTFWLELPRSNEC